MKLRNLLIVVGALAVLAIAATLIKRATRPAGDPVIGQPLVSTDVVARTAIITLSEGNTSVTLDHRNGQWTVSDFHGLRADFDKLARLVDSLTGTPVERLVTSTPERMGSLGFENTRIIFSDTAGRPLLNLNFGKDPGDGGRFIRYDDEPRAYYARLATQLDAIPKDWADSRLVSISTAGVARIECTFANGTTFVLSRPSQSSEYKTDSGTPLRAPTVNTLANTLCNLRFTDVAKASDPAVSAALTHARLFKLTDFSGQTVQIAIGRLPARTVLSRDALKASPALFIDAKSSARPANWIKSALQEIPAGPIYVSIQSSSSPTFAQLAFRVADYIDGSLPRSPADLISNPATAAASSR